MRRSSGMRQSLSAGPLRVRNEGSARNSAASNGSNRRSRSSSGNRTSFGRERIRSRSLVGNSSANSGGGRNQNLKSITKFPLANYGTATQNRRPSSGIGIRGRTDIPSDPRPIKDRAYQSKCIRILCQFLSDNNYPHAISTKILQSPTSKDFFKIFEFLFRFLRSSYKVKDKPEEEVPRLLKMIGYPFSISKSYMFAVGSPHTWPHLLAALTWLIESIQNMVRLHEDPSVQDGGLFPCKEEDFDSMSEEKILFDYVEKTYRAYMSGVDEYDEYDAELSRNLKEKYMGVQNIDDLTRENARLHQELEDINAEMENQKMREEQRDTMERDAAKFSKYLQELGLHQKTLEKQLVELGLEIQTLSGEKEKLEQDIQHMQMIHRNQEFTPADVDRLRERSRELQRQIDMLEGGLKELDGDMGKEEMSIAKKTSKLEMKCAEHNKLCQTLKLIPFTAELAGGLDLELKATDTESMTTNFERVVKPHVLQVLQRCKERLEQKRQENQQLSWNLEQKQEYYVELEDENRLLERDINRVEEELEYTKESFRREEKQQLELLDSMQKELMELQKHEHFQVQAAEADLLEVRKRCEQHKKEFKEKEAQMAVFLSGVFRETLFSKEKMQKRLQSLLEDSRHCLEMVKSDTKKIARVLHKYKR